MKYDERERPAMTPKRSKHACEQRERRREEAESPFAALFPELARYARRILMRVYVKGVLRAEAECDGIPALVAAMKTAKRDLPTLLDDPHMLEFEFPEAPEGHRFLRLGTDTSMMKDPVLSEIRTGKFRDHDNGERQ